MNETKEALEDDMFGAEWEKMLDEPFGDLIEGENEKANGDDSEIRIPSFCEHEVNDIAF